MPHPFTVLVTHALRNIVRPPPGGVTYEKVEEELYSERQERQRQKVKAKRCAPPHALCCAFYVLCALSTSAGHEAAGSSVLWTSEGSTQGGGMTGSGAVLKG